MSSGNTFQEEYSTTALVDRYLDRALAAQASDIHIEPESDMVRIRFRIDGVMQEAERLSIRLLDNLISRIKVLANLNISESRIPQDGRFEFNKADMRVSTFPTTYGECAVIRILDQAKLLYSFEDLGLNESQEGLFGSIVKRPYGLILVTGPTGSGKTTTLFSILNLINSPEKCIVTLEDPPEYHLPMIRQTQIDPHINFDFAQGLRSLFRQNPDIIMLGEIRDRESAEIAVQASLTGHLVLSTLHTNDSAGAIIRLREMGIEKFMITTAVVGVISQRLVRCVCPNCRAPYQPSADYLSLLGLPVEAGTQFYRGAGCPQCRNTGYQGRTGIFEILKMTPEIAKLVYQDADGKMIQNTAVQEGMVLLRENGIEKVRAGITTVEEILRVTQ